MHIPLDSGKMDMKLFYMPHLRMKNSWINIIVLLWHLASAIKDCVNNSEFKKKAGEISEKLKMTNGLDLTINLLEREFKNST